jgi:hypothetical protein
MSTSVVPTTYTCLPKAVEEANLSAQSNNFLGMQLMAAPDMDPHYKSARAGIVVQISRTRHPPSSLHNCTPCSSCIQWCRIRLSAWQATKLGARLDEMWKKRARAVDELAELVHLVRVIALRQLLHPRRRLAALRQAQLDLEHRVRELCEVGAIKVPLRIPIPARAARVNGATVTQCECALAHML